MTVAAAGSFVGELGASAEGFWAGGFGRGLRLMLAAVASLMVVFGLFTLRSQLRKGAAGEAIRNFFVVILVASMLAAPAVFGVFAEASGTLFYSVFRELFALYEPPAGS